MSINATGPSPFTMNELLPPNVRDRHCRCEDWARYIGSIAAIGGSWFSFYYKCDVSGGLLALTGVMIVTEHIIEKNCGLRARVKAAAQNALLRFQAGTTNLNDATIHLEKIGDARKQDAAELMTEQTALIEQQKGLEESSQQFKEQVTRYQAENLALKNTNQQLGEANKAQADFIKKLQKTVDQFSEENSRVKKELEALPKLIASLQDADSNKGLQMSIATESLRKGIADFKEDIDQVQRTVAPQRQEETAVLKANIETLQEQTAALDTARSAWKDDLQTAAHSEQLCVDIGDLTEKLRTGQTQLDVTQTQINHELAELKSILKKTRGHDTSTL